MHPAKRFCSFLREPPGTTRAVRRTSDDGRPAPRPHARRRATARTPAIAGYPPIWLMPRRVPPCRDGRRAWRPMLRTKRRARRRHPRPSEDAARTSNSLSENRHGPDFAVGRQTQSVAFAAEMARKRRYEPDRSLCVLEFEVPRGAPPRRPVLRCRTQRSDARGSRLLVDRRAQLVRSE